MGLVYTILVYLILGVLFTYMHSSMIIYIVYNVDKYRINKKLLLILSYIWISLTFPIRIYGILKRNLKTFEDGINKENKKPW